MHVSTTSFQARTFLPLPLYGPSLLYVATEGKGP